MKAWKTKIFYLDLLATKWKQLGMISKGMMSKAAPDIHINVLQRSRSSRNPAMQGRR